MAVCETKTNFIDSEIVDAIEMAGRIEARAAPGSADRWRGVIMLGLVSQFRQMRRRLGEVDPDWRPTKRT